MAWYNQTVPGVIDTLKSDADRGLKGDESHHGLNKARFFMNNSG